MAVVMFGCIKAGESRIMYLGYTSLRTNHYLIIFNHMHNGITWHNFTYVSINTTPTRAPRKIENKRNFKNFNAQHFINEASYIIPFHIPPPNNSADDLANDIENKIN